MTSPFIRAQQATFADDRTPFYPQLSLYSSNFARTRPKTSGDHREVHLKMEEILQKLTSFPPSQPLSDAEYDKQARGLVSLLHQGKLLSSGAEIIKV